MAVSTRVGQLSVNVPPYGERVDTVTVTMPRVHARCHIAIARINFQDADVTMLQYEPGMLPLSFQGAHGVDWYLPYKLSDERIIEAEVTSIKEAPTSNTLVDAALMGTSVYEGDDLINVSFALRVKTKLWEGLEVRAVWSVEYND